VETLFTIAWNTHVETAGLRRATDEAIWRFARDHGFAILSKDDDFSSLALVRGARPKVIWLQIGNSPTSRVVEVLKANALIDACEYEHTRD
jgi:predicted nuclease of predicted toxin-antitoxin system